MAPSSAWARTTSASSAATTRAAWWLRELGQKLGLRAWVRSSTDQLHNLSVQGPNSREILKQVVWTPPAQPGIAELQWFRFTIGRIGDFNGVPFSCREPATPGNWAMRCSAIPRTPAVWDAIAEAGKPHGIAPCGLEALDMLRIEAGLIFYGYEFCDQTDPFEAGIGFTVPLKTKTEDFVGREALLKRREHPQRRWSASTSRTTRPRRMATVSSSAAPRSASSPAARAHRS